MSPKRRTVVKLFKEQFAPKVKDGTKTQTVRPRPKHKKDIPRVGDLFSARQWSGRAYHSPQIRLREGEVTEVHDVCIYTGGIYVDGVALGPQEEHDFARADGFEDFDKMAEWFEAEHGLPTGTKPFEGILIRWKNDPL